MDFLRTRIRSIPRKRRSKKYYAWLKGEACISRYGATKMAEAVARKYGWAFLYEVRVKSLHLPVSIVQYFVTPIQITTRLDRSRVIKEEVFFYHG